jgi:hypothetical protein
MKTMMTRSQRGRWQLAHDSAVNQQPLSEALLLMLQRASTSSASGG